MSVLILLLSIQYPSSIFHFLLYLINHKFSYIIILYYFFFLLNENKTKSHSLYTTTEP